MRRGVMVLLLGVLAGCGSRGASACQSGDPIPVDGGLPGGPCASGDGPCSFLIAVPVTPSCGVRTDFACTCDGSSWACTQTSVEHNACPLPDGGFQ